MNVLTESPKSCQQRWVRGQFLDMEELNTDMSSSLFSLFVCSSINHISQFSFNHLASLTLFIMAHLNGLSTPHSPSVSPLSFTISRPSSLLHLSLFGKLTLPLPLSPCLPLSYPSAQTSVSKRLVVSSAKPSAQIWITAV